MRDAQGLAFFGLVVVAASPASWTPPGTWSGASSPALVGVVSLGCFYAALAGGTMGVVAPIAATGVIVPVAVGIAEGESPTVAAAGRHRGRHRRRGAGLGARALARAIDRRRAERGPLLMAGVAALGFGTALVLVAEGGEHSVVMTIVTMRSVNAVRGHGVLVAVSCGAAGHPTRADLPALIGDRRHRRGRQRPLRARRRHVARERHRGAGLALPGGHRAAGLALPPRAPAPHPGGRRRRHAGRRRAASPPAAEVRR